MTANLGNYYASKKAQVPGHRSLELSFVLPRNLSIPSNAAYEWKLLNADGSAATWHDGVSNQTNANGQFTSDRQGSLNYNPANGLELVTNVKLPFVLASQDFRLQLSITGNGPNGDGTKNFTKDLAITVDPLFRRLKNVGKGGCLRATGGDALPSCNESSSETGEWPDIRWTWNEDKQLLISKDNSECFGLSTPGFLATVNDPFTKACDTSSGDQRVTFNSTRELLVNDTKVCSSKITELLGYRDGLRRNNDCSGSNSLWKWLD